MTDARCWLESIACGTVYALQPLLTGCPHCRLAGRTALLEVRYDLRHAVAPDGSRQGLWRWRSLPPDIAEQEVVSLGEGGTPLRPFADQAFLVLVGNVLGNDLIRHNLCVQGYVRYRSEHAAVPAKLTHSVQSVVAMTHRPA